MFYAVMILSLILDLILLYLHIFHYHFSFQYIPESIYSRILRPIRSVRLYAVNPYRQRTGLFYCYG
jgi:hypothetical protein